MFLTSAHGSNGGGIDHAERPVDPVDPAELCQEQGMQAVPDPGFLQGAKPSPATHG